VYIGKLGNAYFHKSIIAGQTDFLYGFGTAWIQSSQILLRNCGGGITAWKGTNTSFSNNYGVYIVDSTVKAANASIAPDIKGQCALGRPWNSLHRSVFARTSEDASIKPSGYIDWIIDGAGRWSKDTVMAEYRVSGPGFNATGRKDGNVTIVLDDKEWARYSSPAKVFQHPDGKPGNIGWIDWATAKS
jgi:pectinesterase